MSIYFIHSILLQITTTGTICRLCNTSLNVFNIKKKEKKCFFLEIYILLQDILDQLLFFQSFSHISITEKIYK